MTNGYRYSFNRGTKGVVLGITSSDVKTAKFPVDRPMTIASNNVAETFYLGLIWILNSCFSISI